MVKIYEIFTLCKKVVLKKKNQNYPPLCDYTLVKSPGPVVDGFTNCFQWYLLRSFNKTHLQNGQTGIICELHQKYVL